MEPSAKGSLVMGHMQPSHQLILHQFLSHSSCLTGTFGAFLHCPGTPISTCTHDTKPAGCPKELPASPDWQGPHLLVGDVENRRQRTSLSAPGRAWRPQDSAQPLKCLPLPKHCPVTPWNEKLLVPFNWASLPRLNAIYHLIWYDFSHMFFVY